MAHSWRWLVILFALSPQNHRSYILSCPNQFRNLFWWKRETWLDQLCVLPLAFDPSALQRVQRLAARLLCLHVAKAFEISWNFIQAYGKRKPPLITMNPITNPLLRRLSMFSTRMCNMTKVNEMQNWICSEADHFSMFWSEGISCTATLSSKAGPAMRWFLSSFAANSGLWTSNCNRLHACKALPGWLNFGKPHPRKGVNLCLGKTTVDDCWIVLLLNDIDIKIY